MRFVNGVLCLISSMAIGCANSNSPSSQIPDSAGASKTSSSRAQAVVSRSGTPLKITRTNEVVCSEATSRALITVAFRDVALNLHFQFSNGFISSGTFDLSQPSAAIYFDASYDGRLLTWAPDLKNCRLQLNPTGDRLSGSLDCDRRQTINSTVSETLNIKSEFSCLIQRPS